MRALIPLLVLLAPLAAAHHLPAAETYSCDVDVGTGRLLVPAETTINGQVIGPCLLTLVDEGYGDGWVAVDVRTSPGCVAIADDRGLLPREVSRNAELPPGTFLWGACDPLVAGEITVELSRLVGFP